MTEHVWSEMIPAYVLDALDPEDRERFEAHLATCEECSAEIAEYVEVIAVLAEAAPSASPPPELKARLMERVREEATRVTGSSGPAAAHHPPPATPTTVTSIDSVLRAQRFTRALPWLVAGAGIAASIAFLLGLNRTRADLGGVQQDLDRVTARVTALAADSARADSVLQAILQPNVRTAFLTQSGAEPELHLYWSPDEARVLLAAFNLPPAAPGRTYQLWGIRAGADPVSLGTFATDAAGTTLAFIPVAQDTAFDLSAVTDEPAGGSPQPTTQPFLVGSWSAASP